MVNENNESLAIWNEQRTRTVEQGKEIQLSMCSRVLHREKKKKNSSRRVEKWKSFHYRK